jgi:cytoskeletal protein CcmA (bactofilin family)
MMGNIGNSANSANSAKLDMARRNTENVLRRPATSSPALPTSPPLPSAAEEQRRRLIVGRDIVVIGEIQSCEHLVVEGRVEAMLKDGQTIDITADGVFKGEAIVQEALVAGRFEGVLTVKERLVLRAGGVITGTVHYVNMEMEAGARIDGKMVPITAGPAQDPPLSQPFSPSQSSDGE